MAPEERQPLVICTTARSGSNLLADYLNKTKLVGNIAEYFNPNVVKVGSFGKKFDFDSEVSVDDYIDYLARTHTGPHGIWGAKLLFEDADHLIHFPAMRDLLTRAKIVFLRRRSKLSQAVSYYLARATGKWISTDQGHTAAEDVPFDFNKIEQTLGMLARQEALWPTLFDLLQQRPLDIVYEEFVRDPKTHIHAILEFVGLDPTDALIATGMSEQKSDISRQFAEAFIKARWGAGAPDGEVTYVDVQFRA